MGFEEGSTRGVSLLSSTAPRSDQIRSDHTHLIIRIERGRVPRDVPALDPLCQLIPLLLHRARDADGGGAVEEEGDEPRVREVAEGVPVAVAVKPAAELDLGWGEGGGGGEPGREEGCWIARVCVCVLAGWCNWRIRRLR